MEYGFIKVASAIPSVRVADVEFNVSSIISLTDKADKAHAEIVVFPELSLTGYTCQDLFGQSVLLHEAENGLRRLLEETASNDVIGIVGAPIPYDDVLLNCGVVFQHGRILGVVVKTYLPNYNEFYEKRWFTSSVDISPSVIRLAGQEVCITNDIQLFRTNFVAVL